MPRRCTAASKQISLEANQTRTVLKRKVAKRCKKLQQPVKMAAAEKEEELFPVNWGLLPLQGVFSP